MTKREWLLKHGYKEYSVNGIYRKELPLVEFDKRIDISTGEYGIHYKSEFYDSPIELGDVKKLLKLIRLTKKDYEQMIKECEDGRN